MKKATRNQLIVAGNIYQGSAKKVLCVCSGGILRSPTMADVLYDTYEYNTRSCGTVAEYALIPISEALIRWADEIVVAEDMHKNTILEMIKHDLKEESLLEFKQVKEIKVLNIPDSYSYGDETLKEFILEAYNNG